VLVLAWRLDLHVVRDVFVGAVRAVGSLANACLGVTFDRLQAIFPRVSLMDVGQHNGLVRGLSMVNFLV